ncbi:MAG: LysR family transcriptional regulator [Clostridia bacterium]|nr:LysR family transcriptional regulator [Clostridia bacterium]
MNINHLKYFNAVCEYGKVSTAASVLHISQPSLSGAIKELEQEFGVSLFKRQHSGMILTPEGKVFYELTKDLTFRAEQIKHIMSDMGNERKLIRLGVPPMIGALILPHMFGSFQKEYPEIQLEIVENGREELLSKLSEGYLDMIFMLHNESFDSDFVTHKIADLEIVCYTSKDNPLSLKECITARDLESVPLVMFKDSFFQTKKIKNWFYSAGIKPNIILQTDQLSTVQSLVASDIAVGFMFKKLIKGDSHYSFIPTISPICTQISLVWRKDMLMPKSINKIKNYIDKLNLF